MLFVKDKKADNDNVNDNDNVTDNVNDNDNIDISPFSSKIVYVCSDDFPKHRK